jgi:uncharacterized membrane protein YoaK (UPF0700 family)
VRSPPSVDVISFAWFGGVFASAMTGNLAFLGLYLARFSFISALSSGLALVGFVAGAAIGTPLTRERKQHAALAMLLACEAFLLAAAAAVWFTTFHQAATASSGSLILLFAVSMGLQSVVGKRVNLANIPTVVLTSTLTNIVIAATAMMVTKAYAVSKDTRRQCASFLLYFLGAFCAGCCVLLKLQTIVFLPVIIVGSTLSMGLTRLDAGIATP